jgi:molybdopterin biosynthesis enzyme MoaB
MSNVDVIVVNGKTGEVTKRDFTPDELAQREADAVAEAERQEREAKKQAAKQAAIKSGRAKLLSLGLTNEEVEAMTNG